MMSQLSAVWLLLAAAAAIELYDEVPPVELDNEMTYLVDAAEAARLQDLLLYRLLKSQFGDETWKAEGREHTELQAVDMAAVSSSLAKRLAQSDRARPQQRWKSKKGRGVGPKMVCYFKLCAFRNPV